MDKLSSIPWNINPMISREPTLAAFQPLLEKNRSLITSVPKKTFKYGETDRHCLDIYYPPTHSNSTGPTPIFFFVYGGGFISGARNRPQPFDLVYSCLGSFFARQGFITVIADYRLAPDVKYPGPVEDVLQAIQWTLAHKENLITESTPSPDLESLFVMGHSAGAVHAATLILHPTLIPVDSDLRRRIKGAVLASGPYHYYSEQGIFEAYYGSMENAKANSPLSLLLQSFGKLPKEKLPKLLLVAAQYEPEWIMNMGLMYQRVLEWHFGEEVPLDIPPVHNHISLNIALSSGEGEEWGVRTADWMKNVVQGGSPRSTRILKNIEEKGIYICSQCQQRRARSFSVDIGTESTRSKTFIVCANCGNKWME